MDLFEHYAQLVAYEGWANQEVIASLRAVATAPERSRKWMAHIVAAGHVWHSRLTQQPQPYPVWPDFTLYECEKEAKNLTSLWKTCLDRIGAGGLSQTVSYKNTKGELWSNTVHDILTHVFMHSAYHRGQIAADLRQSGNQPAYTDFIHGVRQGLVE
jgi:uncharacterized damage-inducible protein DinB